MSPVDIAHKREMSPVDIALETDHKLPEGKGKGRKNFSLFSLKNLCLGTMEKKQHGISLVMSRAVPNI